ncbi:fumarylacetoacetate hydrolase family protein [Ectobacillus antri]|jgi:2-keto-4-pentenoate hydratase/2-oxohepta-3-ene-1,7-dioic acid hydratase in catechol pathway|uniref:Fumarylacetoacetate hydrolase family protein n=1 Tax=Ectobacillus antri TaxID=2486280 RepID=A0ABT6H6L7_9BACI|nr:fumarylacetoacetate hydrolase family protein [Ectobacillus antri]MDG4657920.1 fumarylacetoacetate hydrolase family protein [Ectobacillus antri]MDG5754996.1 fumarylacetoacetate hydrolase family protein [Ectobacillus antri]
MKFVTFINPSGEMRAGWLHEDRVVDMEIAGSGRLPSQMLDFLAHANEYMQVIAELPVSPTYHVSEVTLCAPLPNPGSIRDFYAFEEHVKTARGRRGLSVVSEWYDVPVFYFTNHRAVLGPEDEVVRPVHSKKLDYELEIACIIGKQGRDITVAEADDYIFGYCILNDWSARDLQMQEVQVGLGPAKGKDFATSLGPYIVTKDELERYRQGDRYNLTMTARVNGEELSRGNFQDIHYTFMEMIARASADVTLYPGDVIGSGTVGTGCILEHGTERWLQPGDVVELEVTGLGVLRNTVKKGGKDVLSSNG